MLRKTLAILMVLAAVVVTIYYNFKPIPIDAGDYAYAPFPVKVLHCGFLINCSYSYVWWGIVASIVFWIAILLTAYVIGKKRESSLVQ